MKIAQQRKFGSIVELIQTGKSVPESSPDPETDKPKHSYETLLQAAINGHVKIIQEFVEQRYESKEDKKSLCYTLIQIAKKAKQWQIVDILEPYYYSKLKTDLASDMEQGGNVTLTERYKKILFGYLSSLSDIIANSSVTLDPMDPNSYAQFFSDLTKNIIKRSQTLQEVNSEQDVKNLIDQDLANSKEQLAKINEQLEELLENRNSLEARIEDVDERLFKQEKLTASQRQTMFEERETEKKRLAAYDCSMFIFQRQQEAMLMRQNTINFIKNNPNLIMFYRTVENRLEALFHSILAAQGGYVKKEATFKNSRRAKMVNALPTNIPVGKFHNQ